MDKQATGMWELFLYDRSTAATEYYSREEDARREAHYASRTLGDGYKLYDPEGHLVDSCKAWGGW